jgi:hypothetical protein
MLLDGILQLLKECHRRLRFFLVDSSHLGVIKGL